MKALGWFTATALVAAYLGIIGPMDYADALVIEAENKVLRAELAAAQKLQAHPSPREAPVWSARCAKLGLQFIALQSDAGMWRGYCVNANLGEP